MNRDKGNFKEEHEINEAVKRYEQMIGRGAKIYFDVYQIEHIVERYVEEGKIYPALQAIEMGFPKVCCNMVCTTPSRSLGFSSKPSI